MNAFRRAAGAFAVLVAGGALVAQGENERTQAEIARMQRQLQSSRSEADRLLDLRLRHDLGLPADGAERTFRQATPVSTESMERMDQELRSQEAENMTLVERYEKLRTAVDALRAEATAKTTREEDPDGITVIPQAGSAPSTSGGNQRNANNYESTTGDGSTPGPLPADRPTVAIDPATMTNTLDPVRAQIHGSTDHLRVAHALFKAGQALMDRATTARDQAKGKDEGLLASARDLDDRGKDRLRRALDELGPLLQEKQPPFEVLFCRGRCLELLFRFAERNEKLSLSGSPREWQKREQEVRDPFLQIAARDLTRSGSRGEAEVLGAWGKAAQSAIEHFRWMNLNAGYDALPTIRALTWPGERDQ